MSRVEASRVGTRGAALPTKPCEACGREMSWRKRWARDWNQVRYCSDACRRRGVNRVDGGLELHILELLAARKPGTTICPSEAARRAAPAAPESNDKEAWRGLIEPARRAARRLAHAGRIEITQKGRQIDPTDFRGPIRLRLPRH